MITKEKIKREIDRMPNDLLEKVYIYINRLKSKKPKSNKIHTYKLKGQFDKTDVRKEAYE